METEPDEDNVVKCPLSSWFYRRVGIAFVVIAGMALYFLYDGAIGYPKKNLAADLHDAFIAGQSSVALPETADRGFTEQHVRDMEAAFEAGREGSSWTAFAAGRKLSGKEPKRYTEADISEQFLFAGILGALCVAIAIGLFFYRGRHFRCTPISFTTPDGTEVAFSRVEGIDLRKWDRGIARVRYRDEEGKVRQAKVDDYQFSGAGIILKRLYEQRADLDVRGDRTWFRVGSEEEPSGQPTPDGDLKGSSAKG